MRFLADENVSQSIVAWLRLTGNDVVLASELSLGSPDVHWLGVAANEQRIILTTEKDFGELVFRDRLASFGIVLLRLDDIAVPQWLPRLQEVWAVIEANPNGRFIVVTSKRIRVRPLS